MTQSRDTILRPIAAAIAVVVRDGQVILVRRANPPDKGYWGFPGGRIELGESTAHAAVRELREETGVTARPIESFAAIDVVDRGEDGAILHHFVLAAVLCEWLAGDPRASDDALEARWFDLPTLESVTTVRSFGVDTVARKALALARARDQQSTGPQ